MYIRALEIHFQVEGGRGFVRSTCELSLRAPPHPPPPLLLRQHEDVDCEYYRHSQWAWHGRGSMQYKACNYVLAEYMSMCGNYRTRAFKRYQRHRLR